ncbi:unnamed protein product [Orchesella dallaii]|uniref:Partial AB-hydrolase lipase domain-containing protein n=1 Tax=Orchesella dallaii TaxID=48710 RepID=A0ABP1S7C8_9HEXA
MRVNTIWLCLQWLQTQNKIVRWHLEKVKGEYLYSFKPLKNYNVFLSSNIRNWKNIKMILINGAVIFVTIHIVFCEETFPLSRLTDPIRLCQPHIPLPVNISRDPTSCDKELASATKLKDPEADKNIAQIATENGFLFEVYNATTSDGYILTTFRIPGGPKSEARKGKPAVLLLHGLGGSSETWIALPNDKNLAFMLANAGWDVWLANNRGSTFSNKHITLNPDFDLNYWEFRYTKENKLNQTLQ